MKALVTYEWDEELGKYSTYIPGVPVCGEGTTKRKALKSLKDGLMLFVEEEGQQALVDHLSFLRTEIEEVDLAPIA